MSRIAVIGNTADSMVNFRYSLLEKMVKDHEVFAVCPDFAPHHCEQLKKIGVHPINVYGQRLGLNPIQEFGYIFGLCKFLMDYKIDICFSFVLKPAIYSTIAGFLTGVRQRVALIEGLGFFFTYDKKQFSFKVKLLREIITFLMRISFPLSHKVVFLNREDEAEVKSLIPCKVNSLVLGGIGVDLKKFQFEERRVNEKVVFILIGRMLKEKGINEFIEAAARICSSSDNADFWLVGDLDVNPGSVSLNELKSLLVHPNIKWLGHVSDVRTLLSQADVFVLPSYREGFPRSTQEAMALGKPIITTDVQGCRDTVVHQENGLLIKPKNVTDLEQAMRFFIEKKHMIPQFGKKSRELAESSFDSEVQDNKLLSWILSKKT